MGHGEPPQGGGRAPGAQRERTALAWQRTLLGAALGGIVLAMAAIRAGVPSVGAGAAMLTVYVMLRLVRRGPVHDLRHGRPTATWEVLVRIVGVVGVLGVLGAVTALVEMVRDVG